MIWEDPNLSADEYQARTQERNYSEPAGALSRAGRIAVLLIALAIAAGAIALTILPGHTEIPTVTEVAK